MPQNSIPRTLHRPACILALALATITAANAQHKAPQPSDPRAVFLHPSPAARPMVRWWWFGPAVTKPEILRELQQMKTDGVGGAELAFVYPEALDDTATGLRNLAFLSPEHLDAVRYAQAEGRKLGLRIDVTLCSGWPYGGSNTPLSEAAARLKLIELPLPADATSTPKVKLPEGDSIIATFVAPGEPKHWNAAEAKPADGAIPSAKGPRVALIFVASHTLQQVKRAAVGAEGYVLDPFSHKAVETHLNKVGEPLLSAFGSTPPYAIFSDSLEAYGADWTPTLPEEFRKRRGYDLLPHLPELYVGGSATAANVRHDWGRTLTELVDENYLVQINQWARKHHTRFRSQTYGEPAVSLASQRLVDLPEGEGPQWRAFSTLRWATSANHLFGNNVTSGETFTWLHSPVFRATALDMKAEADVDFLTGENQLIFHGWPYSAPQATEPGWSLYAAGAFNDHNPWHPVLPAVNAYITRVSALLRMGKPANQLAILLPTDDAWAAFVPGKVTVTGAMSRLIPRELQSDILAAGYNDDFIDADTIDRLGLHHAILLIPPTERIPVATLDRIAKSGSKVLIVGHTPTQDAEGKPLNAAQLAIIDAFPHAATIDAVPAALHTLLTPDLTADATTLNTVGFIRRRLPNADIYYIANTGNTPIDTTISLASTHAHAEQWDPDSTATSPAKREGQRLHLAPYASTLFIFTDGKPSSAAANKALLGRGFSPAVKTSARTGALAPEGMPTQTLTDLTHDWTVHFPNSTTTQQTLSDWSKDAATRNFSGEAIYTHTVSLPKLPTGPIFLTVNGGSPVQDAKPATAETHSLGPDGLPNPLVTRTGPGMSAHYDSPIREAALVVVNGKPAGALWHPPYQLDIAPLLHTGANTIELRVYNTALNAWFALPPHDYKPLIAKYGDRFQMQDLDKVHPLPSGLIPTTITLTSGAQ